MVTAMGAVLDMAIHAISLQRGGVMVNKASCIGGGRMTGQTVYAAMWRCAVA